MRPASRRAFVSAPISVDLPTPGGPVKPTTSALPGVRVDLADQLPALRAVVLDERDRARERAAVAVEQALGERRARSSSGQSSQGPSPHTPPRRSHTIRPAMELLADPAAADAPPEQIARRHPARRPRRCTAGRSRSCASCAPTACSAASYARLLARSCWLKLRYRGRLQTDGHLLHLPAASSSRSAATRRCASGAGRGSGTARKIRVHEGEVVHRREDGDRPGVHRSRPSSTSRSGASASSPTA